MSEPSRTLDLDTAEKRCEAATPGPWKTDGEVSTLEINNCRIPVYELSAQVDACWIAQILEHHRCSATEANANNAHFIAHARTDLPEAIRMLREYERLVEGMEHESTCDALQCDSPCDSDAEDDPPCDETCRFHPKHKSAQNISCNCIRGRLLAVRSK